ncbi:MAG: hypothetical protein RXR06_08430 [Thermoproteus sp.]
MEREPFLFRDLFLEALRSDGRIADALLDGEGCRRPSAGAHRRAFPRMGIRRRLGLHHPLAAVASVGERLGAYLRLAAVASVGERLGAYLREVCPWRSLEGFLWGVDGKGLF